MPLEHSASDEARDRNIAEMIRSGMPRKRAEAAAYRMQREMKAHERAKKRKGKL